MPIEYQGELEASKCRIAIVVARYNQDITHSMMNSALETIDKCGGDSSQVAIAHVPGALELPVAAAKFARSGDYDAVICFGCVIRGQTTHYDVVVDGTQQGLTGVGHDTGLPIIMGVLTTENRDQALERISEDEKLNTGIYAAHAAIEMANLMSQMDAGLSKQD